MSTLNSDTQPGSSSSLSPSPMRHVIDDVEVELMSERQQEMHMSSPNRVGIFIPHNGTKPHLVHVFALAGTPAISSHRDLDVFQWLPSHPFKLIHYTILDRYRVQINVRIQKGRPARRYLFIFYKQNNENQPINYLMNQLNGGPDLDWEDNVLIMKLDKEGHVLDMANSDLHACPKIIQRSIAYIVKEKIT